MPFVERVTSTPTLAQITQIPQIVIIDQTGPAVSVGPGIRPVAVVGEFLGGPFVPTEVTSGGQFSALFGGLSVLLSQDGSSTPVQNGSGIGFNGNGAAFLKRKKFQRLVIQRVDTDMVVTDGGTPKAYVKFTVKVDASDRNAANNTIRDIIIPKGTRFADAAIGSATVIVALSQDVVIPAGTATTTSGGDQIILVDATKLVQTAGSTFTYNPTSTLPKLGATAFFVLNTTLLINLLTTAIDTALPNVLSTLRNSGGDVLAVNGANAATAIWAPGTGGTLALRIEGRYAAAIDKLRPNTELTSQIKAVASARRSLVIRDYLVQHAIDASESTMQGRVACVSADPAADTTAAAAATALAAAEALAGVESINKDRCNVSFPMTKVYSDELGRNLLLNSERHMLSILSNFPSEKNPGADPDGLMDDVVGLEDAFEINTLQRQDYANLQAGGVCAIRHDPTLGWWYENGVTAVNPTVQPTRVPLKRRMMADEIQAGVAQIAAPYLKQPATTERVDAFVGELEAYLAGLLSLNNPAMQRIAFMPGTENGFVVDAKSGNTPQLTGIGIFTIIIQVRLLASMDDIVLNTQIGETVTAAVEQAA